RSRTRSCSRRSEPSSPSELKESTGRKLAELLQPGDSHARAGAQVWLGSGPASYVVGDRERELAASLVAVQIARPDFDVVLTLGQQGRAPAVGEIKPVKTRFAGSVLSGAGRIDPPERVPRKQRLAEVDRCAPRPYRAATAAHTPAHQCGCHR